MFQVWVLFYASLLSCDVREYLFKFTKKDQVCNSTHFLCDAHVVQAQAVMHKLTVVPFEDFHTSSPRLLQYLW